MILRIFTIMFMFVYYDTVINTREKKEPLQMHIKYAKAYSLTVHYFSFSLLKVILTVNLIIKNGISVV